MTPRAKHITRRLAGFVFVGVGLAALSADFRVAYLARSPAHLVNVFASLILIYIGLRLWLPTVAQEIAREVISYVPSLGSLWPGGSRRYDPPPQPGVPPPPSVGNVRPPHLTDLEEPPKGGF